MEESNRKDGPPSDVKYYYVGIIDILGLKNHINGGPNPDAQIVLPRISKTIDLAWNELLGSKKDGEEGDLKEIQIGSPDPYPPEESLISEIAESKHIFSDTLMVHIRADPDDPSRGRKLHSMCYVIGTIMSVMILKNRDISFIQLASRGAIAYGPAIMLPSKSIYLGKPIIDAYALADSQNWMGALLHHSVDEEHLAQWPFDNGLGFDSELVQYNAIPADKYSERAKIKYALNWTRHHPSGRDFYPGICHFKPLKQDIIEAHLDKYDWDTQIEKRENTHRFAAEICKAYARSEKYLDKYSEILDRSI